MFRKLLLVSFIFTTLGCNKEYEILESVDGLILSADSYTKIINQTTTLTLKKGNGEDVTNQSEFYVNGQKINNNTFVKSETGTYVVTARYKQFNSNNQIELVYHDGSLVTFKSNVLVEDYTGVWCGNCPRVVHALDLAASQLGANSNQLIKVAIHRSSSNPSDSSFDPYNFDSSLFEPSGGYPKAFINRKTRWTPLEYNNLGMVINQTQTSKRLGLKIENTLENGILNIKVSTQFTQDFNQVKLVVYVLENGLIYDQINYTTFYGGVDPITNFTHDHTLRYILTNHLGDPIPNSLTGSEYSKTLTTNLSILSNTINAEVVAFIVDNNGNVLNARKALINEIQEYQFN